MNRASVSNISQKDCVNHSILDAGLIVYHTPHPLAVTTFPPPRHPCHSVPQGVEALPYFLFKK